MLSFAGSKKIWGWCVTPIFICFLLAASARAEIGPVLWPDKEHKATRWLSMDAGGYYLYFSPGGYTDVTNLKQSFSVYHTELMAHGVPVLSRFRLTSTAEGRLDGELFEPTGRTPVSSSAFLELKSPFRVSFLGADTHIYIQYGRSYRRYTAKLTSDVHFKGEYVLNEGEQVTFGEKSQYIALAVSTPVTMEDAIYSYSRFGIYYFSLRRPRSVALPDKQEAWILNTHEWHSGLFYDISKPVFFNGFIFRLYLNAGFGMRGVLPNEAGYTTKDFDSSRVYLFSGISPEISYRFDIVRNVSMRLTAGYEYSASSSLQGKTSRSGEFRNNSSQQIKLGGVLNVFF